VRVRFLTGFVRSPARDLNCGPDCGIRASTPSFSRLLGFKTDAEDVISEIIEIASRIRELHLWTIGVSAISAFSLLVLSKWFPKLPSALLAMIGAAGLVAAFHLRGVTWFCV
jgi:MFS superfamily sulfate permease-like transporter